MLAVLWLFCGNDRRTVDKGEQAVSVREQRGGGGLGGGEWSEGSRQLEGWRVGVKEAFGGGLLVCVVPNYLRPRALDDLLRVTLIVG